MLYEMYCIKKLCLIVIAHFIFLKALRHSVKPFFIHLNKTRYDYNIIEPENLFQNWRCGREVRQSSAKATTSVRTRSASQKK